MGTMTGKASTVAVPTPVYDRSHAQLGHIIGPACEAVANAIDRQ